MGPSCKPAASDRRIASIADLALLELHFKLFLLVHGWTVQGVPKKLWVPSNESSIFSKQVAHEMIFLIFLGTRETGKNPGKSREKPGNFLGLGRLRFF